MNEDFPVIGQLIHLNHAAVGPWPKSTAEVVQSFANENALTGSKNYLQWLSTEQQLRRNIKTLINAASEDEIALVKNTSEGLSFVACGLDWKTGNNVVGIHQEFPSNRYPWESLKDIGVEFRKLDLQHATDPEQDLFDLCDKNTRLISVSAVQYYNGFKMDLQRIGSFCRDRNILFCVDAIQQIGALEFDVQAVHADFAIADGHKWMLAPEGLGLFYVRNEVMPQLKLQQFGWHMVNNPGDYDQQEFAPVDTAKRFECGSPNMMGIHAMNSSLDLLLNTGMENIGGKVLERTQYLIEGLSSIKGNRVLSNTDESRLSGIVTFSNDKVSAEVLYNHLMKNNILCAPRGGGIRLSPHFYTPLEQLDEVFAMIEELAQ